MFVCIHRAHLAAGVGGNGYPDTGWSGGVGWGVGFLGIDGGMVEEVCWLGWWGGWMWVKTFVI